MSNLDDDEALFEDLYGDDEKDTNEVKEEATNDAKDEGPKQSQLEQQLNSTPEVSTIPLPPPITSTHDSSQTESIPPPPPSDPDQNDSVAATAGSNDAASTNQMPVPPQFNFDPAQYAQFAAGMSQMPQMPQLSTQMPPPPPPVQQNTVADSGGKMFIGGLNWDTTEEGLLTYFGKFGEIIDYTIMKDNATGRSRGFGFLTFKNPASVDAVIKQTHELDGKLIDPKRAISREDQDRVGKIFIGGIDPMVTEFEFNDFFSKFGEIIDCQLMIDKDTGRSRGFGFITFSSPDAVDKVCVNKYLTLNGKAMEVKRAAPRGQHNQQVALQQQQQQQAAAAQQAQQGQFYNPYAAQYGFQQMNPQDYMKWYQQWYMFQQAQQAQAGGVVEQQPSVQPLNPQQQADVDTEQANATTNVHFNGNGNDIGNGSSASPDSSNVAPASSRPNIPRGPKRLPPNGPSGGFRGRGGYRGRSRGFHPYRGSGGRGRY
ncbi:hypothetical protein KGF54_003695 [Candida jiufengensis]|uniref:uncharacterized protein n=1 Tax=Candida jiufengensis TaxID=497108 RepID=UPI002223F750|nr:uncharacterized protein KGF54_003695 [Candida jiufengensis]KAI5952828.1 hypothetical protein KGF54_003695 [Candida jiufengensis]